MSVEKSGERQNRWVVTREQFEEAERKYVRPSDSGYIAQSAQVFYDTDADTVAELLPPPLAPGAAPTVWVSIGHMSQFNLGVAQVAVACRYGDEQGWYCLHLPMTTEPAVVGGRERYGENKKIAVIRFARDGASVTGSVTRYGITYLELAGTVTETLTPPESEVVPHYYFKYSLAADGSGFDHEPLMVRSVHTRRPRLLERLDAELTLRDSRFDPLADLPVVAMNEAFYTERSAFIEARVVERVDPDAFVPYVYQRYDFAGQG